ncbi:hypothetical protein AOLI_G00094010 [Acnodon oligacanthus]
MAMKTLPAGEHQITVVAARSLERAQKFAETHGNPKAYGSYQELPDDPDIGCGPCVFQEGPGRRRSAGVYCLQFILMVFKRGETKVCPCHRSAIRLRTLWHAPAPRALMNLDEDGMERAATVERKTRTPPTDTSHESDTGRRRYDRPEKARKDLPFTTVCEVAIMAIRWGICSAGKISHDFTVALKTLPQEDHQVVAVAARNLQRAEEFAQKHNISTVYGSYEELARDPNIDVVYVGTIHPHHLPVGILLMNAKKNVLIEKPLAMNLREVQELVATAKMNDVFLMEAVWTRFFPASLEISKLLSQEAVGEVKMVRADFGVPLLNTPRSVEKELGGGALLDIGIYCLQFVLMVYGGEKPECIQATGVCLDTGVDESMVITLKFSRGRLAVCTCTVAVELPNDAIVNGTKGAIRVPAHMWCPTSLIVNGKETPYPVPEPYLPLNFINSTGMRYEAEEVRQCLLKGLKESSRMSHADSALLAEIMDEARRQVGVVYSQDCQ